MIASRRTKACFGFRSLALVFAVSLGSETVLQDDNLVAQGPQPPVTLPKEQPGSQEPTSGEPRAGSDKPANADDWEAQLLRDLGIDAAGAPASRPESQPADTEAAQRPPSEAQVVVDLMRSVAGSLRSGSLAPDTLERQRSILQWLDQWFPSVDAPASSDSHASDRSASGESPSVEKRPSESGSKGQDGSRATDSRNPSDAATAGKEGNGGSKERSMGADGDSRQATGDRGDGSGNAVGESVGKSTPPAQQDGSGLATEGSQPDGQLRKEGGGPSSPDKATSADNQATGATDATGEPRAGGQGGENQGADRNGASDGVTEGPPFQASNTTGSQGGDSASPSSEAGGGRMAGRPGEGDGTGQSGRLAAGTGGVGGGQGKMGEPSRGPDGVDQAAWNDPSRLRRGVWGHLPQQVHQQMLAAPSTEFLPSHRKAIEAYYRRLSEAKR
jgi:hypothetical protein